MIHVPFINVKTKKNKDGLSLTWCPYSIEEKEKYKIVFQWFKTTIKEENGKTKSVFIKDPNFLNVVSCCDMPVLCCLNDNCHCFPQLRYNSIIKKWKCNCCTQAMVTKNLDEDELETIYRVDFTNGKTKPIKGYFEDPIEAILDWNKKIQIKSIKHIDSVIKKLSKIDNKYIV